MMIAPSATQAVGSISGTELTADQSQWASGYLTWGAGGRGTIRKGQLDQAISAELSESMLKMRFLAKLLYFG